MLHYDNDRKYYVYPSWATLSPTWEELPQALADPFGAGGVDKYEYNWVELGYTIPPEPFETLNGHFGGGIVVAMRGKHILKWLPALAMPRNTNFCRPSSIYNLDDELQPAVCYLEPWDLPWPLATAKTRPKVYIPYTTIEHTDAANDRVYWAIANVKGADRLLEAIRDASPWIGTFGLTTKTDVQPDDDLLATAGWLRQLGPYVWVELHGAERSIDLHFAIMLYVALHLKSLVRVKSLPIHLVANIEGKPGIRSNGWY